jgi:hypothetical protein
VSRALAALLVPLEGERLVGVRSIVSLRHGDELTTMVCVMIAFTDSGQVFRGPRHNVS